MQGFNRNRTDKMAYSFGWIPCEYVDLIKDGKWREFSNEHEGKFHLYPPIFDKIVISKCR